MWVPIIVGAVVVGAGLGLVLATSRRRSYSHGLIIGDSLAASPVLTRALHELTGTQWTNVAVSGRNSGAILDQLRNSFRPNYHGIVVVSTGGNDGGRDLEWTQRRIRQIVSLAHRGGADVVLLTEPPMRGYRGSRPAALERSEASRRWVLRGGSGASAVVDLHRVLGGGSSTILSRYDGGDHLHPNRAGRRALAQAIVQRGHIVRNARTVQTYENAK